MRVAVLLAALLVAGAVSAEEIPSSFAVVEAGSVRSFDRQLREYGRSGHRVVGSCRGVSVDGRERFVALLERSESLAPIEYTAVALPGELDSEASLQRLSDLGRQGYRLLPEHLLTRPVSDWWLAPAAYEEQVVSILERTEPTTTWEYVVVPYGDPNDFHRRLDHLADEGFALLGIVNSSRRPRVILAGAREAEFVGSEAPYRMVLRPTKRGLRRALGGVRRDGYGVADVAQPSIHAPPIVIVGKTSESGAEVRYKLMRKPSRKARRNKLEKKLNARGKKGFRVLPMSASERAILLVRDEPPGRRWEYRALSSARAPGLPRALERAARDGHRFVAMFHEAGETTVLVGRSIESDG